MVFISVPVSVSITHRKGVLDCFLSSISSTSFRCFICGISLFVQIFKLIDKWCGIGFWNHQTLSSTNPSVGFFSLSTISYKVTSKMYKICPSVSDSISYDGCERSDVIRHVKMSKTLTINAELSDLEPQLECLGPISLFGCWWWRWWWWDACQGGEPVETLFSCRNLNHNK